MTPEPSPEDLGPPDLKVFGFQLWIHGRRFEEATDYWDGNWLRITAHCGAPGASIWATGAILMVTDIASFGKQCSELLRGEIPKATLDPLEPELCLTIEATDSLGHLEANVRLTPDHLSQVHQITFMIDQSYLPDIINQSKRIVETYPVRGKCCSEQ